MSDMKQKFVVMKRGRGNDTEVKRFDTLEEALTFVKKGPPADLLMTVEWYIRLIWTNSRR